MPELPVAVEDPKSLTLGAIVAVVALLLMVVQEILGRSRREPDPLVDPGRVGRRRAASLLMFLTGLTMAAGSTIGPKVAGRPNALYLAVWLLVLAEVAGLLLLAWRDLGATRRLARSLREELQRENLAQIDVAIQSHRTAPRAEPESPNGSLH